MRRELQHTRSKEKKESEPRAVETDARCGQKSDDDLTHEDRDNPSESQREGVDMPKYR